MVTMQEDKRETVNRLKQSLLQWQGIDPRDYQVDRIGLGLLEEVFPGGMFPTFGIHEFISKAWEETAAACGFIGVLLGRLMAREGVCLWVSTSKLVFPPALQAFGVATERILFVEVDREQDVLWVAEEALSYNGLVAVVAELQEMDFSQSRRLQLAVEKSRATGLIVRCHPRVVGASACVARWRIRSLPSLPIDGLPGIGFPRWRVELLKVRNGSTGCWHLEWLDGQLTSIPAALEETDKVNRVIQSGSLKKIS